MIRSAALALVALSVTPASAQAPARPLSCSVKLNASEQARALLEVKLQEEMERADAQTYLTRLELSVTKQKLAVALKKCGEACAPTKVTP